VNGIGGLVLSGRAIVAVLSTLCVWITWRIGRRLWTGAPGYALLGVAFLAINRLQMSFGSSELPNPVAAVLVAGAFLLLLRRSGAAVAVAGVVLGVAATFRFSEVVFIVPAGLGLLWQRRWVDTVSVGLAAALSATAVLGAADYWFWGEPFFSIRQAIGFTVVQRQSSGGFQSPLWYLVHVDEWTTWVIAALALFATRRGNMMLALWAWTPVVLLSLFPHKEERYLITVTPFICLLAADGVRRLLEMRPASGAWRARPAFLELALMAALWMSLVLAAEGWRLRRTDADVGLARAVLSPSVPAGATVAIEQVWRAGGYVYLQNRMVEGLDPAGLSEPAALLDRAVLPDWLVLDVATVDRFGYREPLRSRGYEEVAHTTRSTYRIFRR
jgi:hypothetical protein